MRIFPVSFQWLKNRCITHSRCVPLETHLKVHLDGGSLKTLSVRILFNFCFLLFVVPHSLLHCTRIGPRKKKKVKIFGTLQIFEAIWREMTLEIMSVSSDSSLNAHETQHGKCSSKISVQKHKNTPPH